MRLIYFHLLRFCTANQYLDLGVPLNQIDNAHDGISTSRPSVNMPSPTFSALISSGSKRSGTRIVMVNTPSAQELIFASKATDTRLSELTSLANPLVQAQLTEHVLIGRRFLGLAESVPHLFDVDGFIQ